MPISIAKKAAKRESTAQIVIEKDAKIAELEAHIKILNFHNGNLVDDDVDFSAGETAIIELAALKVKYERLLVKHENLEEFKCLQGEKLKKIDECLVKKLGKVDHKRLLKGLQVDSVERRLRAVLARDDPDENNPTSQSSSSRTSPPEAAAIKVVSPTVTTTATQWEEQPSPSDIKPGQFIELGYDEEESRYKSSSKKKLKPSESVEQSLNKLSVNSAKSSEHFAIYNELLKVIANLLYGCALSDEAHIGTLKKLRDIEDLAERGVVKVIKNRHGESIEFSFKCIIDNIDELRGSKRKMDLAREAFSAIYKISRSKKHVLYNFMPFIELVKDFFIDVGNRGLFIQSTDNILAILEFRANKKLTYDISKKDFPRDKIVSKGPGGMTRIDVAVKDSDNRRY